jgi:hypothetical protein
MHFPVELWAVGNPSRWITSMTKTAPPVFRYVGQYRPRGHRGPWSTLCERATEAAVWDELLSMTGLVGCELAVRKIEVFEAEPV